MLVGAGLALLGAGVAATPASAETSNRIVAIVNGDVITEADVASRLTAILEDSPHRPAASEDPQAMHRAVLDRLIEQRLMLQEAKRLQLTVGPDEIAEELEALRRRFGSEEALRQSLAEAGLSKERLKEQMHEQLLVRRAIDVAVRSKIVVSPHEVAEALPPQPEAELSTGELVEVWHLLVRVEASRTEEQARERIQRVRRALAGGTDFSELAQQYSDDPNAAAGGSMGWVAPGVLMPELDAAVFSLAAGECSEPIHTRLGYHLVKVGGRRTASSMSALEAKQAVEQRLYQRKFQDAMQRWLGELKRRAYIEIRSTS